MSGTAPRPTSSRWMPRIIWLLAFFVVVVFWKRGETWAPWAFEYPRSWNLPLASWIGDFMKWLLSDASFGLFTFAQLTRFLAAVIDVPYSFVLGVLSNGFVSGQGSDAVQILPPLSWVAVIAVFGLLGHYAGGRKLALLAVTCLGFVVVFDQWNSAMITLASILIAVPLGVAGGLLLGLLAYRSKLIEHTLRPVLDLMQTIPVFAYLVPILILFGFGPVSAVIATVIYAMPPMTRITLLALQRVPSEIRDLGHMVGCTKRQMTWKVLVPSAQDPLMVGVNQVIMLSLNMVIIASMIGAGGLGFDVLAALRRLDFGAGVESGFAIVALAVALDRLSQALARRAPDTAGGTWMSRHPYSLTALAVIAVAGVAGLAVPAIQTFPDALVVSTGDFWSNLVAWINVNYFDVLESLKNSLLLNVLIPFKRFLLGLPWSGVALLIGLAGWQLGGVRLAVLTTTLTVLIAITGLWEKAMITVYLCGISTVFALAIGIPIGLAAAERARLWPWVQTIIDTLQTLPSFVYLMPAVMLFRVGDFTAMIAVVAFAVAPAIRYTALGLRGVDPRLIEAAHAMGCTSLQVLLRVKLRLAFPEILLGVNQTVMFALSMLVITALVGTRDLGQEVYIALTKADPGRGLTAGLAVAFIAIIADRLIHAAARNSRARLGLLEKPE